MAKIEDTFYDDIITSPTVSRDYDQRKFTIQFSPNMAFITGKRGASKIIHPKYKTISELQRGNLHELLDTFMDDLINGQNKNTNSN